MTTTKCERNQVVDDEMMFGSDSSQEATYCSFHEGTHEFSELGISSKQRLCAVIVLRRYASAASHDKG
jgi:hypothetical protein